MCLGFPACVVAVDADRVRATVSVDDGRMEVFMMLAEPGTQPVRPGDWLLVHSGIALERLSAEDARHLLDLRRMADTAGGSP